MARQHQLLKRSGRSTPTLRQVKGVSTRLARFILALIVGLALLTWAVSGVVQTTTESWLWHDVRSRAQLVLTGEKQSLAKAWNHPEKLNSQ